MRVFETDAPRESYGLIARSGTWLDRLPDWLVDPESSGPSGSSMGPRDRLLIGIALVAVAIWGFTGSWEYPTAETSFAVDTIGAPPVTLEVERVAPPDPAGLAGAELFQANGCYACHSLEGERKIGPSLNGIFGESVKLDDGSVVPIDDAYIVESILQPDAKRVAGFEDAAMPSYEGLVSAEDAAVLAEYIKALGTKR